MTGFSEQILSKIELDRTRLPPRISNSKRIVFTNGCFDILHPGHVEYLARARDLGDLLIVAINSDASVKRLKGESRPINTLDSRAYVLAGLACVDFVTSFEEDTPEQTLALLKPHIHTKGGDYSPEALPEKRIIDSYGGSIVILPFVGGHSTTSIINRSQGK